MGALLKDKGIDISKIIFSLIAIIIGFVMVIPFLFMVSSSFKPQGMIFQEPLKSLIPTQLYLDNYKFVFSHNSFLYWYINTIKVTVFTIAFRTFLITTAAYAFAKLNFRFKNILFMSLIALMMIPGDVTLISRYLFYGVLNLRDTHWVLILPASFDVFFLFFMRQFYIKIPKELNESAYIDGCSHFKIYYKIILPLSVPALVTLILFTFIWTWNDYLNPFMFITPEFLQTLTVGLQYFQGKAGSNYAAQLAGATLGIIPAIILFIISQKYFVQGIAQSGIKG